MVSWPESGMVWMLGGRAGSTVLQDNEVLVYPQERRDQKGETVFDMTR